MAQLVKSFITKKIKYEEICQSQKSCRSYKIVKLANDMKKYKNVLKINELQVG